MICSSRKLLDSKEEGEISACSGHFQKEALPQSQGSFFQFMEDLVKVGHTMGYKIDGGILCVWDPSMFEKHNTMIFDYFITIRGKWIPNAKSLLIISVYAPQDLSEKKMLWDYLQFTIENWAGEMIIMGDFNEVRTQEERFGSIFNSNGAAIFNHFISSSDLVEVPMGGCTFTWVHKSDSKMSKLDRFLISNGLMQSCPNISALTLDRYLSDHRPILLREVSFDYGPTPFRFFHFWFDIEGFDTFVEKVWKDSYPDEPNAMIRFMRKLKFLKQKLRLWISSKKENLMSQNSKWKSSLVDIDKIIDLGKATSDILNERMNMMNSLHDMEKIKSTELAQKTKIKWSIEGDENSKYFHGVLNKRRNNLAIRGILVDGVWIDSPNMVKNEFLSHFAKRFDNPSSSRLLLDMNFPNQLSSDAQADLENNVTRE
ncbi:RNA-directed DNA polymerase, eukaryota [Tanacetum coccineum]